MRARSIDAARSVIGNEVLAAGRPGHPPGPWIGRSGVTARSAHSRGAVRSHHDELDERGRVSGARIVGPASRRQAAIEGDPAPFDPSLDHTAATHRLDRPIRSYDPCFPCAMHFLDLRVETHR